MSRILTTLRGRLLVAIAVTGSLLASTSWATADTSSSASEQVIVTSDSATDAAWLANLAGGQAGNSLPLVNAVAAQLTASQVGYLTSLGVTVTPDVSVPVTMAEDNPPHAPSDVFPQVTGASQLTANGTTGAGVGVAVLDTGIDALPDFSGRLVDGVDFTGEGNPFQDDYGHGTFVAGLIAGNGASSGGAYVGEAPGANLISIKVAGASGVAHASTIIRGIDWAIKHADSDNIRVLNLSLGAIPTGPTATEPMDQAVERAWQAGIVVVASAGNSGPNLGTILSPGDDPMVMTVGANDDNATVTPTDDAIPSFSSEGPTQFDGWLKPDLVAPGRSVISLAAPGSTIYNTYPSAMVGSANFVGSGTSFSTAITSGATALLLQAHPYATPNRVKARLLTAADPAASANPVVAGHGELDVAAATAMPAITLSQSSGQSVAKTSSGVIPMSASWTLSTWNPANYSGPETTVTGTTWNGSTWNGTTWNGTTWNGTTWNGTTWNGTTWNGTTWNGTTWNGTTWNGSTWN